MTGLKAGQGGCQSISFKEKEFFRVLRELVVMKDYRIWHVNDAKALLPTADTEFCVLAVGKEFVDESAQ